MVFYDHRSHGRSGRSSHENATVEQLARDLLTVADALAPDQQLVLMGHSMGGIAIIALAELHPELDSSCDVTDTLNRASHLSVPAAEQVPGR